MDSSNNAADKIPRGVVLELSCDGLQQISAVFDSVRFLGSAIYVLDGELAGYENAATPSVLKLVESKVPVHEVVECLPDHILCRSYNSIINVAASNVRNGRRYAGKLRELAQRKLTTLQLWRTLKANHEPFLQQLISHHCLRQPLTNSSCDGVDAVRAAAVAVGSTAKTTVTVRAKHDTGHDSLCGREIHGLLARFRPQVFATPYFGRSFHEIKRCVG